MDAYGWYWIGLKVSFLVTFIAGWIYCIHSFGAGWGAALGWLPSLIAATIISFLWPLFWPFVIIVLLADEEWRY